MVVWCSDGNTKREGIAMLDKNDVLPMMSGLWPQAISDISGVSAEYFSGKHVGCPICQDGKDRFRFDDNIESRGDGGFICSQCGSGSGIKLLMGVSGMNFSDCLTSLSNWLGHVPQEKKEAARVEITSRAGREKYGTYLSHDECVAALAKCSAGLSIDNLRHGIAAEVNLRHTDRGSFIFAPVSFAATPEMLCDVAVINSEHDVKFMSGGMPAGAVTIIEGKGEYVYLCSSWLDAWHTHYGTGAAVWCCWSATNISQVAHRNKGKKMRVSCLNTNMDTIFSADEAGLDIVTPRGNRWSAGVEKKLYKANELCDGL